jgi:hypothetical protein
MSGLGALCRAPAAGTHGDLLRVSEWTSESIIGGAPPRRWVADTHWVMSIEGEAPRAGAPTGGSRGGATRYPLVASN